MNAYSKEMRYIESFHFEYDSNQVIIFVSSNHDGDYISYDNPLEYVGFYFQLP